MKRNVNLKRVITSIIAATLVFTSAVIHQTEIQAASDKAVKSVTLKVKSKKVSGKTVTLKQGEKVIVKVAVKPASAKKSIAYKSSKKNVVKISKKGVVTARETGTSKITVTVTGKNKKKKSAYFMVHVEEQKQNTAPVNTTPDNTTQINTVPTNPIPSNTNPDNQEATDPYTPIIKVAKDCKFQQKVNYIYPDDYIGIDDMKAVYDMVTAAKDPQSGLLIFRTEEEWTTFLSQLEKMAGEGFVEGCFGTDTDIDFEEKSLIVPWIWTDAFKGGYNVTSVKTILTEQGICQGKISLEYEILGQAGPVIEIPVESDTEIYMKTYGDMPREALVTITLQLDKSDVAMIDEFLPVEMTSN